MPEGGGGEPCDEVGTLNVCAHPTWGILANFEHQCWPQGYGSLNNAKMAKVTRVLNAGNLATNVPPS